MPPLVAVTPQRNRNRSVRCVFHVFDVGTPGRRGLHSLSRQLSELCQEFGPKQTHAVLRIEWHVKM